RRQVGRGDHGLGGRRVVVELGRRPFTGGQADDEPPFHAAGLYHENSRPDLARTGRLWLDSAMAYVVADPCVKCKYTDCVAVCPVDCFYEGKNSLAINPDECIDCGACEPECPTTAIFEESELPAKWAVYKDINALVSGAKKADELDTAAWPEHLKSQAAAASTWKNI